jgi:hypothetical protein
MRLKNVHAVPSVRMSERAGFQQIQAQFAQHIRDPDNCPAPDAVEDRRMQIYRRLFFNNIDGFLQQAFPVLNLITPEANWSALVRRFYAEHQCRRPQFYQMAEEFLEFLQNDEDPQAPAFRLELAHYEWIELVLSIDPAPVPEGFDPAADGLETAVVFTPWMQVLSYTWPVHLIRPEFLPTEAPQQPTWLLVYRKPDEHVGFLQINMLTARLVELLQSAPRSRREVLTQLAREAQLDSEQVMGFGADIFKQFRELGLILGGQTPGCG